MGLYYSLIGYRLYARAHEHTYCHDSGGDWENPKGENNPNQIAPAAFRREDVVLASVPGLLTGRQESGPTGGGREVRLDARRAHRVHGQPAEGRDVVGGNSDEVYR